MMNGSFRVPNARVLQVTPGGFTLEATVEKTGFFGNVDTSVEQVPPCDAPTPGKRDAGPRSR